MHQKNWMITGLFALIAAFGLYALTSSAATDKITPPVEKTTCCKTSVKDCKTKRVGEDVIHETLSRQFL
jgi:hypothetical protein